MENGARQSADNTTTAVFSGSVKRLRGRSKGSGKKKTINVTVMEVEEKGTHHDERDALGLTKALINVSQRSIQSEDIV